MKFELTLELERLFLKGTYKFELTLECSEMNFFKKEPIKVKLTLEINELFQKGTYKS